MTTSSIKADPSRTSTLRRVFEDKLEAKFNLVLRKVEKYLEDNFSITSNALSLFSLVKVDLNSEKVIKTILKIQSRLDPSKLVSLEDDPHITVRYGLHTQNPSDVKPLVEDYGRTYATVSGISLFKNKEYDVLKLDILSQDLINLSKKLGSLANTQTHDYRPHITIAYLKRGTGHKQLKKIAQHVKPILGELLKFEAVTFSDASRETTRIPTSLPTMNARYQFNISADKISEFKKWLYKMLYGVLIQEEDDTWLQEHINQAYSKGLGRGFDEVSKGVRGYKESRSEFLKSAFGRPVNKERVKLLIGRTFEDLRGVSNSMAADISRLLVDGMIAGVSPREIGSELAKKVKGIHLNRAKTIARTEILRAHNEGALDAMEAMGVEEVGVLVEWSTAEDEKVCPLCAPLEGIILRIEEAHGMFPRHPNCRCVPIPSLLNAKPKGTLKAILASVAAERKKGTLEEKKAKSNWYKPLGSTVKAKMNLGKKVKRSKHGLTSLSS